jgi:hypothetical protein
VLVAAACLMTASCSRTQGKPQESAGPTVDVPEFVIAVRLSPQAETRLKSIHESIEVLAMFDGDPLPGQGKHNPPNRDVVLGSAERPVDGNNEARFKNVKVPLSDWDRLADKDYFVTINTFSARKADENNLLDCDDPMSRRIGSFRGKTIEVRCGLIGEPHNLPK